MWFILEDKELYRSTGRKINSKWGIREAVNIFNSWLYHKVAISNRKGCGFSGMQQIVQNDIFYNNNKRNISRRIGKIV